MTRYERLWFNYGRSDKAAGLSPYPARPRHTRAWFFYCAGYAGARTK